VGFFFFQAEDGIRDFHVTGVQTCALPISSQTFVGAVVAYANPVKQALLGVSAEALEAEGAVSETVAQQMARGALEALKVDVAVRSEERRVGKECRSRGAT